ncbi:conserved hypothetical protein [Perkinsus marinus ATCC 50983]|uniref:Transmembrane 9 superfamily member n=1 Tax=Perkinsus marinus (strain ATCC 50983 / TXsc) TaxID=423536 RepID=C5KLS2_PERM5|nr:conserved hypothetical protein [Perkinsus marinus ATCC 50983]EER14566.1 conserved hypothetical protein [Perkinsus marinus ATCC 50983]|eukprot:XP_002782771.1 conserved hypothetical protein [Perkinsus marinus ATCC 50983]
MRPSRIEQVVFALTVVGQLVSSQADMKSVRISMNKIWPFANPTETYRYYDLPFCKPEVIESEWMSFGQILKGDRLVNSIYSVNYREDVPKTKVCQKTFTEGEIEIFQAAIEDSYMFEMFVSRRRRSRFLQRFRYPCLGRYFLLNYFEFTMGYNDGVVVSVNMTTDMDLEHVFEITEVDAKTGELEVPFYYSVKWVESPITASEALETQMKAALMSGADQPIDIQILAIINSFVLIMLILSLLLLVIIRVVRSDLSRYLAIPDEELAAVEEETGWKLLCADVFRPPVHRLFLSAAVGAGAQLLLAAVLVVLVGCIGLYYQRGAVMTAGIISYLITAASGGYVSARLYNSLGGEKWAWNIFVTAIAFMGPAFGIWMILNTVAIAHKSMKRKSEAGGNMFPCKTNKLAREIPSCHWYQSSTCQMIAAGFLPFSAIYIELHYIFNSVGLDIPHVGGREMVMCFGAMKTGYELIQSRIIRSYPG